MLSGGVLGGMRANQIAWTAGIALLVVIGFKAYEAKKTS